MQCRRHNTCIILISLSNIFRSFLPSRGSSDPHRSRRSRSVTPRRSREGWQIGRKLQSRRGDVRRRAGSLPRPDHVTHHERSRQATNFRPGKFWTIVILILKLCFVMTVFFSIGWVTTLN
jgi:hypothetical protein